MNRLTLPLLVSTLLAGSAVGQCFSLVSTTAAGNGQKGAMFDVVNVSGGPISIGSFDQCFLNPGTSDVEIYTLAGTLQGNESNAAAWTLVGSATGVVHASAPVLDAIPIAVNVTIQPGATQAFYITCTAATATNVAYTTGSSQYGVAYSSNTDLQIVGGVGKSYPFAATFGGGTAGVPGSGAARLWNGQVNYCPAGSGTVLATNTTIGAGCGESYASFYEFFAQPANYDLAGLGFTLVPGGNGGYVVTSGAAFLPVGSLGGTVTPLTLADDAEVFYPFTVGSFSSGTGAWTGLSVISNGKVCQNTGNATAAAINPANMLNEPNTGVYFFGDWDPSVGGTISVEETSGLTTVTWDNVPSWNNPGTSNNFQFQFFATGEIGISCGAMANIGSNGGILVGYTPGGANVNPGSSDLSSLVAPIVLGDPNATEVPPLALAPTTRPIAGGNWDLSATNLPAAGTIGVEIFGLSDPGINDLTFLGMPGCGLRSSLDSINAWVAVGAAPHTYSLPIPTTVSLLNNSVFATVAVFAPGANLFGAITSNGVEGVIGDF